MCLEDADVLKQEFSIEIPDKEADAIHSGKYWLAVWIVEGNYC